MIKQINKIIIHHSASDDNPQFANILSIRDWHINNNGWDDIGYNWIIELINNKPLIIKGRSYRIAGAHTLGQNDNSIGICMVGNFNITMPSDVLYNALKFLIKDLLIEFNIPSSEIYPHSFFNKTDCPGKFFDINLFKGIL